ncbi:unnamed protein product [Moneuplotes crassus]|uniref:Calpain catalytic domain-containing protein n=1 Tax=Euplotes crassus TaxID=5936 RepID=A0AAD2DB05_EUPCR|nr:unnamed protein product [Moneuplotes crassus]
MIAFIIICSLYVVFQAIYLLFMKGKPERIHRYLSCINVPWLVYLLNLTVLFLVFGVPFILYIIWGSLLIADDDVNSHVGFGVMFLLFAAHLFALGAINWYARKWRITLFNFGCLVLSIVFLWLYLIFVITLPDYFSFTGTSAVFLGLSFLPVCFIHYRIDSLKNKVEVQTYMKTMEAETLNKSSPGEILTATRDNQKKGYLLWCKVKYVSNAHLGYLVSIASLIVYAILIRSEAKKVHSDLGFINMALVIITDLILILWGMWSRSGYYVSPTYVCLIVLATRALLCVWPYYWIITHSAVFLILLMMFATVWIFKNIHVDSKESRRNKKQQELLTIIQACPELQQELSKDLEGMNPDELVNQKKNQLMNALCELVPITILLITFIVYGSIIWTTDINRAVAKRIIVDNQRLHQGLFVGLAIAIFFAYSLIAIWLRLFQLNSYKTNCYLLFQAIISYIAIIFIGILYGNIVLDDVDSGTRTTAITAFCIAPLYIFTICIFYGIWMHNFYNFYASAKIAKIAQNMEERKDMERNDSNDEMVRNSDNGSQNQGRDQGKDERKKVKTKYRWLPRCHRGEHAFNDFLSFSVFWINVIGLLVGFIICIVEFEPRWIVAFIWAWAMLIEFGAMGIIRFMHHGYSSRDEWIWICIWVCIAAYICSAVSFGFGIDRASDDDETTYIIAFLIIHVGVILLGIYLTIGYKIKQEIKKKTYSRVIALGIMLITLLIVGLLLIFVAEWYASGCGILTLCFYLFLKIVQIESCMTKWFSDRTWNIIQLTLLTIIIAITTVILIIELDDEEKAALEVLSYASYLLAAIFCVMFYFEYSLNEQNSKHQIYVYSTQLLPMLKYVPSQSGGHDGKMVQNNSEYIYFFAATLIFLTWSIIAGMLLKEDERYIGLACTSLVIIVAFLYVVRNYNKANYFKDVDILQLSWSKYCELQIQAMEYRDKLTKDDMNVNEVEEQEDEEEQIDPKEVADRRETILKTTKEWKELERVWTRMVMCGKKRMETKIELDNPQTRKQHEDFQDQESLYERAKMITVCDERVDSEIFNNVCSRSYFKGLIVLHLQNFRKELKSKVKAVLNEMTILLKDSQFKDHLDKLHFALFEKMNSNQEFNHFNQMFAEYARLRQEKLDELRRRQEEEEKKRLEREQREAELAEELGEDDINLGPGVLVMTDVENKLHNEFNEKGDQILNKFKDMENFEDDAFYGDKAISLTGDVDSYSISSWLRPHDMVDSKFKKITNPKVIVDGFGCNDIGQGGLGDCWFLSAMSCIAFSRPDMLKNLFHPKTSDYTGSGPYVIRFYKNGKLKICYIDDRFPCRADGRSVFCKTITENGQTELWPLMLEKAFAKIHNSYEAIDGGFPDQALVDMTNGIAEDIRFDTKEFKKLKNDGSFWQKLLRSCSDGHLMAASSKGTSDAVQTNLGIVEGHAYSVLDVQEIDNFKLIQLRNPWGSTEWKGDWSDTDKKHWTKKRLKVANSRQKAQNRNPLGSDEDDGAFWMSIDDFINNYSSVSIVRIYEAPTWRKTNVTGTWKGETAGGCPNHDSFGDNPQFKLTVPRNTSAIFNLSQTDKRGIGREKNFCIGWSCFSNNGQRIVGNNTPRPVHKSGTYTNVREKFTEISLKASDKPYTFVCSTFKPGEETGFTLSIITKEEIFVESL